MGAPLTPKEIIASLQTEKILLHQGTSHLELRMKLYRSHQNPTRWYAHSQETGWVMFPAQIDGWERRQPARGIDPIDVREVPIALATGTGMPGAPSQAVELQEAA